MAGSPASAAVGQSYWTSNRCSVPAQGALHLQQALQHQLCSHHTRKDRSRVSADADKGRVGC